MKTHLSRKSMRLAVLLVVAAASAGAIQSPADPGRVDRSIHPVVQAYENLTEENRRDRAQQLPSRSTADAGSTLPGYMRSYLQLFR
jgi:hypothetical protein